MATQRDTELCRGEQSAEQPILHRALKVPKSNGQTDLVVGTGGLTTLDGVNILR